MKRLISSSLKILGLLTILLGLLIVVFTYGYLIVLALIFIGVGLMLYLIDYWVKRFSRDRKSFWALQSIFTILYISSVFVIYMTWQEHNYIIFPKNFKGQAGIIFGIAGYPELPKTKFWKKTIVMPDDGVLITSTKVEDIPNTIRCAYANNPEFDETSVNWDPNFEIDCIVCDSRIKSWLFNTGSEVSTVKDVMTSLCNEIASRKRASAYKSVNPVIQTDSRGPYLLLNWNSLTSLPNGLEKFNLYKVLLAGNEFKEVPEQIFRIKSLETLIMADNPINEFPCNITQLKYLKSISFAKTGIKQVDCDLSQLDSLEHFDLSSNELTLLPEQIKSIPNLTWLSLDDNQLSDLSFIDGRLRKLEVLYLYTNKIKSISTETIFLGNLKKLLLFDNEIERIPDNISDLKNLEKLEIWNNPIKYISPKISQLKNLKSIRMDDDYLTQTDKDNLKKWLPNCEINYQTRNEKLLELQK